jgi:hypothetical protein
MPPASPDVIEESRDLITWLAGLVPSCQQECGPAQMQGESAHGLGGLEARNPSD